MQEVIATSNLSMCTSYYWAKLLIRPSLYGCSMALCRVMSGQDRRGRRPGILDAVHVSGLNKQRLGSAVAVVIIHRMYEYIIFASIAVYPHA